MRIKSIVNDLNMIYEIDIMGMNMNDILTDPEKLVGLESQMC